MYATSYFAPDYWTKQLVKVGVAAAKLSGKPDALPVYPFVSEWSCSNTSCMAKGKRLSSHDFQTYVRAHKASRSIV